MKISTIQRQREGLEAPKGAVALTIEETALEHIIDSLTNIYSRPWQAVIREYVSNALDSHARSGVDAAVKVDLVVNGDDGALTVKDFGSGMTREEIETIYSRYGASLKRDSNTQIGGFGLGAKSALAVVSRFNGISVSNGTAVHFYVERTPGSPGNLVVEREYETTDASSFTIQIPFSTYQRNGDILSSDEWTKIFAGLSKGALDITYTVKGQEYPFNVYSHIEPDVAEAFIDPASQTTVGWLTRAGGFGTLRVVVGGVIYEVRSDIASKIRESVTGSYLPYQTFADGVILNVPIGTVSFTRSREEFIYDDTTKDSIRSTFERFVALVNAQRIASLNEVDAPADVLRRIVGDATGYVDIFKSMIPLSPGSEWRGVELPTSTTLSVTAGMDEDSEKAWDKSRLTSYNVFKQGAKGIVPLSPGVELTSLFNRRHQSNVVVLTAPMDQMRTAVDEIASVYNRADTVYRNLGTPGHSVFFVLIPAESKTTQMWLSEFIHPEADAFGLREWIKVENKKWRDAQPKSDKVRAKRPKAASFIVTTVEKDKVITRLEEFGNIRTEVKAIAADDPWIAEANAGKVFYAYRGVIVDHELVLSNGVDSSSSRFNHGLLESEAGRQVMFGDVAGGDKIHLVILSTSTQETRMRETFPDIQNFGQAVKDAASKAYRELPELQFTGADLDYNIMYSYKEAYRLVQFWQWAKAKKVLDDITHPLLQANYTLLDRLVTRTQTGPLYEQAALLSRYATNDIATERKKNRVALVSNAMAELNQTAKMFPLLMNLALEGGTADQGAFQKDVIDYLNGKV